MLVTMPYAPALSDASSSDIIEFDAYDRPNVMRVLATAVLS